VTSLLNTRQGTGTLFLAEVTHSCLHSVEAISAANLATRLILAAIVAPTAHLHVPPLSYKRRVLYNFLKPSKVNGKVKLVL
jgi:hypothetical protein